MRKGKMLEHDVSEEHASEYPRCKQLVATKSRGESNGNDFLCRRKRK